MKNKKALEWTGVITAIIYSLLVAFNIGAEFLGFTLLLISAILIGLWAYFGKHKGILVNEILKKEPQYYRWIMNSDFPPDTKNKLTEIWLKEFNKK